MTDQQVSSSSQGTVCTGLINCASMKNESVCKVSSSSSSSPPQDCSDVETTKNNNNKLTNNAGVKRMNETTSSTVDSNILKKSRINNYDDVINDNNNKLSNDKDDDESSSEKKADKVMNTDNDDNTSSDLKAENTLNSTNSEKKDTKNDDMMVLCIATNITEDEASSTTQQRENESKKKLAQSSSNQKEKSSNNEIRIDQLNNSKTQNNNPQKPNQQDTFFKGIQPSIQTNQQPEGWRVKLYRLNTDGSWDDCGTGRIVCFINDTAIWGNLLDSESKVEIAESPKEGDHTKDVNVLEEHLYQVCYSYSCSNNMIPSRSIQDLSIEHFESSKNSTTVSCCCGVLPLLDLLITISLILLFLFD